MIREYVILRAMFDSKKNGDKKFNRNFKFRLTPTKAEALQMVKIAGASRHVRNEYVKAVESYLLTAKEEEKISEQSTSYVPDGIPVSSDLKFSSWWRNFKNRDDKEWLRQYNDGVVRSRGLTCEQEECKKAWQQYKKTGLFQKENFPKPSGRGVECSFTIPSGVKIKDGKLVVPAARGGTQMQIRMRANRGRGDCKLIEKLSNGDTIEWIPKVAVVKREALALTAPFNPPDNPSQKATKRRGNCSRSFLRTDKWFVYIQYEVAADKVASPPHTGEAVGIDVGAVRSFQLSDKEDNYYQMPRPKESKQLRSLKGKQQRYKRRMARQMNRALIAVGWDGKNDTRKTACSQLGKKHEATETDGKNISRAPFVSRRYDINKRRMAKTSRKIAHIRDNKAHQISSAITMKYAHIVMENLTGLSKSVKRTVKQPEKRVVQKRRLSPFIIAVWGMMRSKIEYKAAWRGGSFEMVAAANTSIKCSSCGHITKENRKTQAEFVCIKCGHKDNADFNAAKNILARAKMARTKKLADGDTAVGYESAGLTVRGGSEGSLTAPRPMKRKKSILQERAKSVLSENQPDIQERAKPPLQNG